LVCGLLPPPPPSDLQNLGCRGAPVGVVAVPNRHHRGGQSAAVRSSAPRGGSQASARGRTGAFCTQAGWRSAEFRTSTRRWPRSGEAARRRHPASVVAGSPTTRRTPGRLRTPDVAEPPVRQLFGSCAQEASPRARIEEAKTDDQSDQNRPGDQLAVSGHIPSLSRSSLGAAALERHANLGGRLTSTRRVPIPRFELAGLP
jgi:hypothetical protein